MAQEGIRHVPVAEFKHGDMIDFKAVISIEVEWVRFFYRCGDMETFQFRIMHIVPEGFYVYSFDSSKLPDVNFEYFIAVQTPQGIVYAPAEAPNEVYKISGRAGESIPELVSSEFLPPEEERKKFKLPIHANGNLLAMLINGDDESSQDEELSASGNIQVQASHQHKAWTGDISANMSYTNIPFEGEKQVDLSQLSLVLSRDAHCLKVGDINIHETDFTVSGSGRRGVEYIFDNSKVSFHLFDISAQQLKGFNGIGIPAGSISIFGGILAGRLFANNLQLKALYLSGKDDPGKASNIGYSDFFQSRKGNVVALTEELYLFDRNLNLSGEFAHSRHDGDIDDELGAQGDSAWRVGGSYTRGILNVSGRYARIGKDFNPIGYQYFTGDRKGLDANIGLNWDRINLSGSFNNSRDNVNDDPSAYTTENSSTAVNFMWSVSEALMLNLGILRNAQNTSFSEDLMFFDQDSRTTQLSGALSWNPAASWNLNLSAMYGSQSSRNNPEYNSKNLNLNLSGNWSAGETLTIMPSLSCSTLDYASSEETMITTNAFLNAEIAFIPQKLSSAITGSFNRMKGKPGDRADNLNLSCSLNFMLNEVIKITDLVLTAKTMFSRLASPMESTSFFTVQLQCDFYF